MRERERKGSLELIMDPHEDSALDALVSKYCYLAGAGGWSWRLKLEWCERKILLPSWWLESGAGEIRERFTVALEAPASSRTR